MTWSSFCKTHIPKCTKGSLEKGLFCWWHLSREASLGQPHNHLDAEREKHGELTDFQIGSVQCQVQSCNAQRQVGVCRLHPSPNKAGLSYLSVHRICRDWEPETCGRKEWRLVGESLRTYFPPICFQNEGSPLFAQVPQNHPVEFISSFFKRGDWREQGWHSPSRASSQWRSRVGLCSGCITDTCSLWLEGQLERKRLISKYSILSKLRNCDFEKYSSAGHTLHGLQSQAWAGNE